MPLDQRNSLASRGIPLTVMDFSSLPGMYMERYAPTIKALRALWLWVHPATMASSTYREMTVAMAAPSTPISGAPNLPKIRM